jgi:hypothetical protein
MSDSNWVVVMERGQGRTGKGKKDHKPGAGGGDPKIHSDGTDRGAHRTGQLSKGLCGIAG